MQIDIFSNDEEILTELGKRIKHARIKAELTQSELAKECGIAKSTIERIEKGESIQLLILIKILRSLNHLNGFENILPDTQTTPLEYLRQPAPKKRVRTKTNIQKKNFSWGDEK